MVVDSIKHFLEVQEEDLTEPALLNNPCNAEYMTPM